MKKSGATGFTIVELLIVIVVIGILASISVAGYRGIQDRAHNAHTAQFVKNFDQALQIYAIHNGEYPPYSTWWPCLGVGDIDINSNGRYDCRTNGTSVVQEGNLDFNNAIRPYIDPEMKPPSYFASNGTARTYGPSIWYEPAGTVNGVPNAWFIFYAIKGSGACPYGKIVQEAGWPSFSSSSTGYTYTYDNGRGCLMALPNP